MYEQISIYCIDFVNCSEKMISPTLYGLLMTVTYSCGLQMCEALGQKCTWILHCGFHSQVGKDRLSLQRATSEALSLTQQFLCPSFEYYLQERGCGHCCWLWLRNVKSIPGAF